MDKEEMKRLLVNAGLMSEDENITEVENNQNATMYIVKTDSDSELVMGDEDDLKDYYAEREDPSTILFCNADFLAQEFDAPEALFSPKVMSAVQEDNEYAKALCSAFNVDYHDIFYDMMTTDGIASFANGYDGIDRELENGMIAFIKEK